MQERVEQIIEESRGLEGRIEQLRSAEGAAR